MTRTCDNCCSRRDGELFQDALIGVNVNSPDIGMAKDKEEKERIMLGLPISDALSAICCTLWGDPVHRPPEVEGLLELCPTCTETLTQLYQALATFRQLCREQGKVFGRLLELRNLRRRQETVVSVVKLERLPTSATPVGPRSRRQRQRRHTPTSDGAEEPAETSITENRISPRISQRNLATVDKLEVEIKEEPNSDAAPEDCDDEDQSDWNFCPEDEGQDDFGSGTKGSSSSSDEDSNPDSDEDFVINPSKKSPLSYADNDGSEDESSFSPDDNDNRKEAGKKSKKTGTGEFECEICHLLFRHASGRTRHIREKHSATPFKVSCPVEDCGSSYSRREELKKHLKDKHPTLTIDIERLPRRPAKKKEPKPRPKKYKKKDPSLKKDREPRPHKPRIKYRKPCPECGKVMRVDHLSEHLTTHSYARPHLCDLCGGSFKTAKRLRGHINECHTKEKVYSCPHPGCTLTTTRKSTLVRHNQVIHQKLDVICTCEVCGKQFVHARNLKAHQKMHDGDGKGLECEICHKIMSRADNLRTHMKAVHEGVPYYKREYGEKGPPRNIVAKMVGSKEGESEQGQDEGQRQGQTHDPDYHPGEGRQQEQNEYNNDKDEIQSRSKRTKQSNNFLFL